MALTLGSVTFNDDEAPSEIAGGGDQAIAVHKYVGGQWDIQTLGAYDDPIPWDGILLFQYALDRLATLNTMRIAGQPVTLQIGSLSVQVVVRKFTWTYVNDYRIPYHIEVMPTTVMSMQPGGGVTSGAPTVSIDSSLSDLATAAASGAASDSLGQLAMTPSQIASTTTSSPTYVTNSEFSSAAVAPVGAIINQMSPAGTASTPSLASQVTHLVQAGESLWSIATQYYASGAQWTQIAAANNIQNPSAITAGQQLLIPNPTQVTG